MGYAYTGFVIAAGIAVRHFAAGWWKRFKEREALRPVPLKLNSKGVHAPWGRVQKIERVGNIATAIWAIWILALLGVLFYVKALHL